MSATQTGPEEVTVIRLPETPTLAEVPAPRPAPLHGLSITFMAVFALVGIASMLILITVSWGEAARYPIAVFVGSAIGFLASALIAVFAAARDSLAKSRPDGEPRL